MPAPLLTREEILDRLLGLFRDRGFDGASMTDIATATGLGKSSLYHHFPGGKQEMAEAVLDHLDAMLLSSVIAALNGPGKPKRRLDAALKELDAFYEGGERACLLERLTASIERDRFRPRLKRAFAALRDGFVGLARDAGASKSASAARAEDAIVRIEGALVLAAGTKDPGVFGRSLERIRADLIAT